MTTSLRDSIEGLYAAFAASALPRTIDCSPLIADQWAPVEAVLRRKPLRALTGEDLDVYAWRAFTTVGDVDTFKHFLPRLLELMALEPRSFGATTPEVLYGKLASAAHATWPAAQARAVDAHLDALGLDLLTSPRLELDPMLVGLVLAMPDIAPLLERWQELVATSPVALDRLVELVERNVGPLSTQRRLASLHAPAASDNVTRLARWLASEPLRARLEALFFAISEPLGQGERWEARSGPASESGPRTDRAPVASASLSDQLSTLVDLLEGLRRALG